MHQKMSTIYYPVFRQQKRQPSSAYQAHGVLSFLFTLFIS